MKSALAAVLLVALSAHPAAAHWRHHHIVRRHFIHHYVHHAHFRHHAIRRRVVHAHGRFRPPGVDLRRAAANSPLVHTALRYVGDGNVTGFRGPWCGAFALYIARQVGVHAPRNPNLALNWRDAGPHVRSPRPGDIGVLRRRGGGHVGFIVAVFRSFVIMVSGNSTHGRVAIGRYPRSRFIAFVQPRR